MLNRVSELWITDIPLGYVKLLFRRIQTKHLFCHLHLSVMDLVKGFMNHLLSLQPTPPLYLSAELSTQRGNYGWRITL